MMVFCEAKKVMTDGTINTCDYWGLANAMFPAVIDDFPTLLSIVTTRDLVNPDKTPLLLGPRVKLECLRRLYYMGLPDTAEETDSDETDTEEAGAEENSADETDTDDEADTEETSADETDTDETEG